uniref:Sodium/bile acid cotransporter n=1 Tax=Strigamia maritima TaxID=126957 RepID=T1JCE5_STRMM
MNLGSIIKKIIRNNWFIFALILCIFLANIRPEIGEKGGVWCPFLDIIITGLSLKTEDLIKAVTQIRLHLLIQGFSLIIIPFCIFVITELLSTLSVDEWLLKGLMSVSCLPPPVSSAVILTKTVGGNEGLIVTPISLLYGVGITSVIPISSTIAQLTITVTLPFILGQITHLYMKKSPTRSQVAFNNLNSCLLLFIIYTTFCESFVQRDFTLERKTIIFIIFIVALIIQINICALIPTGIPMLRLMFSDLPHLSTLSIPLLIYHPMQIVLGGALVTPLRKWMLLKEKR